MAPGTPHGDWFARAHREIVERAPDLAPLAGDYVGEAHFGWDMVAEDLAGLAAGARVLELGAGSLLLSCALQAAGFRVTAVEPVGAGFSHIGRLRDLVRALAERDGCAPEVWDVRAEEVSSVSVFDFACSINTMEHVDDVAAVLARVATALRPGAAYRFVCPNYSFPYEPHFGIPTCGSKAWTWTLLRRRILASRLVDDPQGTWASLNWISVKEVRAVCRTLGLPVDFDRRITGTFVHRALTDAAFQRRHGRLMQAVARGLTSTGLLELAAFLPAGVQPAMSCRVVRPL